MNLEARAGVETREKVWKGITYGTAAWMFATGITGTALNILGYKEAAHFVNEILLEYGTGSGLTAFLASSIYNWTGQRDKDRNEYYGLEKQTF